MFRFAIKTGGLVLISSLLWACGTPPTREAVSNTNNSRPTQTPQAPQAGGGIPAGGNPHAGAASDLEFTVPPAWTSKPPSSSMRLAEYQLPPAEGDSTGATLALFSPMGGTVEDNVNRWIGQMQQPDGSASKDKAKTEKLKVNGLDVTLLDVSGTFTGDMSGGGSMPDARMRAGMFETSKGNYFIKLVGPKKTVARWDKEFMDFVKSVRLK